MASPFKGERVKRSKDGFAVSTDFLEILEKLEDLGNLENQGNLE